MSLLITSSLTTTRQGVPATACQSNGLTAGTVPGASAHFLPRLGLASNLAYYRSAPLLRLLHCLREVRVALCIRTRINTPAHKADTNACCHARETSKHRSTEDTTLSDSETDNFRGSRQQSRSSLSMCPKRCRQMCQV